MRRSVSSVVVLLMACGTSTAPAPSADVAAPSSVGTAPNTAAAGSSAVAPPVQTAVMTTPAAPARAPAVASKPAGVATPATQATTAMPAAASGAATPAHKMAMDECGLHTSYAGDEYCIKPPPDGQGFQLHIGPSNYESPEPEYIIKPGEENVMNLSAVSGNDKDVDYYFRQYRMRPGSHHVILSVNGQSIGGTQNLSRDQPDFGIIPPENEDVGLPLAAHSKINANMHFYNFSDKPMIRELWVNYWYKDPSQVKETAHRIFSPTGVSAAVAHSHVVVGASCPVAGSGRLLALSGHRHLNNVRFSVWKNSGGKRDLLLDDYDSEHPGELEFNSLAINPAPNPSAKMLGGASGILNIQAGDTLDFECEIVNMTDKNFRGANEAQDDEMCILGGESVGATISGSCRASAARNVTAQ